MASSRNWLISAACNGTVAGVQHFVNRGWNINIVDQVKYLIIFLCLYLFLYRVVYQLWLVQVVMVM